MVGAQNIIVLKQERYPAGCRDLTKEELARWKLVPLHATVLDTLIVPGDLIDLANREYQSRMLDSSPEKIKQYARDIDNRGLLELPLVQYDPVDEVFVVVVGYTRLLAMLNELKWNNIPVGVIDSLSRLDMWHLLQGKNGHPPATAHNMDDAQHALRDLKKMGYFASKTKDETREECYKHLQNYYPSIKTSKKKFIVDQVFEWNKNRVKTFGSEERKKLQEEIYPNTSKKLAAGKSPTVVFNTDNSNFAKMLGNRIASLANKKEKSMQKHETWKLVDISVLCSIRSSDADNIEGARGDILKLARDVNVHGICNTLGRIKQIVFPAQILEPKPEVGDATYVWKVKERQFFRKNT